MIPFALGAAVLLRHYVGEWLARATQPHSI
jgi:hypothetical protein